MTYHWERFDLVKVIWQTLLGVVGIAMIVYWTR